MPMSGAPSICPSYAQRVEHVRPGIITPTGCYPHSHAPCWMDLQAVRSACVASTQTRSVPVVLDGVSQGLHELVSTAMQAPMHLPSSWESPPALPASGSPPSEHHAPPFRASEAQAGQQHDLG